MNKSKLIVVISWLSIIHGQTLEAKITGICPSSSEEYKRYVSPEERMGLDLSGYATLFARRVFWDSVDGLHDGILTYAEYRNNLMSAIPELDFVQDNSHDPLKLAVGARDYDFVEFLLEHGANPNFTGMSGQTAYDVLNDESGLNIRNVAIPKGRRGAYKHVAPHDLLQGAYEGITEEIRALLDSYRNH